MSWFHLWHRRPHYTVDPATLDDAALDTAKKRIDIQQALVSMADARAWPVKLALSLVVPLGAVLGFTYSWWTARLADQKLHITQTYADAARDLDSPQLTVRLNAVHTLAGIAAPQAGLLQTGWLPWSSNVSEQSSDPISPCRFAGKDHPPTEDSRRHEQSIALIIGRLAQESDPAVLDEISQVAGNHICETLPLLLSLDRTAAVQFARSAGTFAALYNLAKLHKIQLDAVPDNAVNPYSTEMLDAVDAVTSRTGSPFEARAEYNQTFLGQKMLENTNCPFARLYDQNFSLDTTALNLPLRTKPPTVADVLVARNDMEAKAIFLERVSVVLNRVAAGSFPGTTPNLNAIAQYYNEQRDDLYGVAIVVGQLDPALAAKLRSFGAYIGTDDEATVNKCPVRQKSAHQ